MAVIIDNTLNFKEHTQKLEVKVSRSVGILRKLKFYLPESALLKLYHSLVHSHLSLGMCLKENYSDSPSNEYSRHYSAESEQV